MENLDTWLYQNLKLREQKHLLRELKTSDSVKDFYSNDYLGLAQSMELYAIVANRIESFGLQKNGATGSRLLSGNSLFIEETEHALSLVFKSESTLIFNSGYNANLAVLSSIPQKGDTILYDELSHASIRDGIRLSLAKHYGFRHNDLNDLEKKIKRSEGKIFIVVESIYSMDGDECPLQELVAIASKHNAFIILDEAHSTGILGERGSGYAVALGLHEKVAIRIYTFGKAMGCHGACVAGSKNLMRYLVNFARPFIYTTALPPHTIVTIACAFDFLSKNIDLQQTLRKKIELFISLTKNLSNKTNSQSAIQGFLIPGNEKAREASQYLQQRGFDLRPILSPTIKAGAERIRICLHTHNTDEEIITLTTLLKQYAP